MGGVSVDTLLGQVGARRSYVLAYCDGGYTTNLPLADVTGGRAWVAFGYDGEPLEPEHGGPARLLVPHLYFWKSAKWVRGLQLLDADEPGFWETLRLQHVRGSMAGTAVRGRLTWQVADVDEVVDETPEVRTIRWRCRSGRPPGRAAPGRPADRRGRLPGRALLLDRLGPGRAGRDHGRAAGRRRGLAVPHRGAAAGDELELRGPIGGYFVWERRLGRRRR